MSLETSHHFSTILASTVHDIKNSLAILQQLTHKISTLQKDTANPDIIQLEFETNRMNHCMMQLLVLYKIDARKFSLDIDEYPVSEILDEVKAQQSSLLTFNHIELDVQYPDELMSFCDYTHITHALGTILNNAQRYSHRQVLLSAYQHHEMICFSIEDDGQGYPLELLSINPANRSQIDWITGNTGLGLYFVATIAELHQNNQNKGAVKIDNNSRLGGARFRLFLP